MPYKSDAQRKKFHVLLAEGKIKKSVVDEFDKASKGMDLPEKLTLSNPMHEKKHGYSVDHVKR
jgi:hypothetical protein